MDRERVRREDHPWRNFLADRQLSHFDVAGSVAQQCVGNVPHPVVVAHHVAAHRRRSLRRSRITRRGDDLVYDFALNPAQAALGADVEIWADVHVKHGRSLAHASIADEAEDAVRRGLADALVVSGRGTGEATSLDDVRAVAELELGVPFYVGSGVTVETVESLLDVADGVIVGSAIVRQLEAMTTEGMPVDVAVRSICEMSTGMVTATHR